MADFEAGRVYFLRGSTLQGMIDDLRTNRPCCVDGGGLLLAQASDEGAFIDVADAEGGGGITPDPAAELPTIEDSGKVYFLRDATVQKMLAIARRNLAKVVDGSGLTAQYSADSVAISYSDA